MTSAASGPSGSADSGGPDDPSGRVLNGRRCSAGDGNACANRFSSSVAPSVSPVGPAEPVVPVEPAEQAGPTTGRTGWKRPRATAVSRSPSSSCGVRGSPARYCSSRDSSSLSAMIPSIRALRAAVTVSPAPFPPAWSAPPADSRSTSRYPPCSGVGSPACGRRTGRCSGSTPGPNSSWQVATVAAKSARGRSSLVITIARGVPAAAHSSHSRRVKPSTPSRALTTNRAASPPRRPARRSPMKSASPGVSRRLIRMPRCVADSTVRLIVRWRCSTSA